MKDQFPVQVTEPDALQFTVADGGAWVDGYRIKNTALQPLVLTAPSALPRIDLAQVGHDDLKREAALQVKQGLPDAEPIEPGADPGFLPLYAVRVELGMTALANEHFISRRELVPLKVSWEQIEYHGDVGMGVNEFTGTQTAPIFVATSSHVSLRLPNLTAVPNTQDVEGALCRVQGQWHVSDGEQWLPMVTAGTLPLTDAGEAYFCRCSAFNLIRRKREFERHPPSEFFFSEPEPCTIVCKEIYLLESGG